MTKEEDLCGSNFRVRHSSVGTYAAKKLFGQLPGALWIDQLLDLKDLNTGVHSTRLAEWGMRVGSELGLDQSALQNLEIAALLHDIGKVGVPDAVLRKPGRLDPDEYALMKKHLEFGWAVLRMLPVSNTPRWAFFIIMKISTAPVIPLV